MGKKYLAGFLSAALILTCMPSTSRALEAETASVSMEEQNEKSAELSEENGEPAVTDENLEVSAGDMISVMAVEADNMASGKDGNIEWVISADGKLTITGTGDLSEPLDYRSDKYWMKYRDSITSAEVNLSGMTNASYLFQGCSNLSTIDLSRFDTSSVTNMESMFNGCSSLTDLDLSNFNTANVTDMSNLFAVCSSLRTIDVSNFNTGKVTSMSGMFSGCDGLTALDVSGFDTSNVIYMSSMFAFCSSLTDLDLSNFRTGNVTSMNNMFGESRGLISLNLSSFDTGNVTNMSNMFSDCTSLKSLDLKGSHTDNVTDMSAMFSACRSLTELDLSSFNTSKVTDMNEMFGYCDHLTNLNISSFDTTNVTDMYRMFTACPCLTELDLSNFNTGNVTNMQELFDGCSALEKLDLSSFDTGNVTNMSDMFSNCRNLVDLNIKDFDTGNVTDMNDMFWGCSKLVDLDMSSFNTEKVSSMLNMFNGCSSIVNLNLSNFNVSNAVNCTAGMFIGCDALKTLHAPGIMGETTIVLPDFFIVPDGRQTNQLSSSFANMLLTRMDASDSPSMGYVDGTNEKVTWTYDSETGTVVVTGQGMREVNGIYGYSQSCFPAETAHIKFEDCVIEGSLAWLFYGLNGLVSVDFQGLTMKNVNSLQSMFDGCINLTGIDFSLFDIGNVTNIGSMFKNCSALAELDLNTFDTSQVTDMNSMFYGCSALVKLDLSTFDTGNVTNMSSMFADCEALTEINLENFDTSNVIDMRDMFYGCDLLETLHTPKVMGTAISSLPGFYTDIHGNLTKDLTSAFAGTVLTKAEAENIGFVDGTGNDVIWSYDPETKTTVITGKGTRSVRADYQPSCLPAETEYVRFEDCEIAESYGSLFAGLSKLKSIDFTNLTVTNPTSFSSMFSGCSSLTEVDLSSFRTTNRVSMGRMFAGCSALTELDLNSFYTYDVFAMLDGCSGLTKLNMGSMRATDIDNMYSVFRNCENLKEIDLTGFNTEKVTDMYGTFYGCSSLEKLDLGNFDTGNVKRMSAMFYGCNSLSALDLSKFDTVNVTDMSDMFCYCGVTALDLGNFDTGNVTDMSEMFFGSNVKVLDLSNFETEKVTKMTDMFWLCSNLEELNISSFNMSNVKVDAAYPFKIFFECNSLRTLLTPEIMGSVVVELPGLYRDPEGRQTRNLTADFADTVLAKVDEQVISSDYNEVLDALKTEEIKTVSYIMDEGQGVPQAEQKEILENLQNSDKAFSFTFEDASGEELYSWTFQGSEITDSAKTVDFQIIVDANDPEILAAAPSGVQQVDLKFSHEGTLPGKANVKVAVGNYFNGGKLCLYYYNPDRKVLELVDSNVEFDGKFAVFSLEHCSSYVLMEDSGNHGISGKVRSFGNQEAEVHLQLLDSEGKIAAETAVQGNFVEYNLADVAAGSYTLQVSKVGHVTREYPVTVQAESVSLDVKIHLIGDVNGDGSVNIMDKRIVYNHIAGTKLTGYEFQVGDVNGDGTINIMDKRMIFNHIAGTGLLW